ncbi:MAG: 5-methyltetrahydropteroyltriglutamate--homocysteine S-methyltransferase [Pseudomonadota bacterium]
MVRSATLGFPRIGPDRELKRALESHWRGATTERELFTVAARLRRAAWELQAAAGITDVPSNDFSLYDHVLDLACMVGAVPERIRRLGVSELDAYFLMARGRSCTGRECQALELTKWFDTNYHYLVPEIEPGVTFALGHSKALAELEEARALGLTTRPTLLGPVSFLLLARGAPGEPDALSRLPELLPVYVELLAQLAAAGAPWVQIDEPCLVLDLDERSRAAFRKAYETLGSAPNLPRLLLASYFGGLGDNLRLAFELPVAGHHLDLVRGPDQLDAALARTSSGQVLELGVVDGRNVWRTDLEARLTDLERAAEVLGKERVWVASSCSLMHVPYDLDAEPRLDGELRSWLAFAKQKAREIAVLARGLDQGRSAIAAELEESQRAQESRAKSSRVRRPEVRARVAAVTPEHLRRQSPYPTRALAQRARLRLPLLPTTTIGSFPQTPQIRSHRAAYRRGVIDRAEYEAFIDSEIRQIVRQQEVLGLDLLVHGEPERNDMVEFFGEGLEGFAVTVTGWVQSYGSRCVKPPILFGDVERLEPLTVREARVAQEFTRKPVKGMLTGPVTILKWSFVRDDQPWADTAQQVALALRDEVADLERAGLAAIQVDEPALREGLPLKQADRAAYLRWAVDAFRLATAGADDATQIHTHMCYADFGDIVDAIRELDADVISLETARSHLETIHDLGRHHYPNEVGPGVYDIHSPRVPHREEVLALLRAALEVIPIDRLWVNPDCGLKTRAWPEVRASLAVMVEAARALRRELDPPWSAAANDV